MKVQERIANLRHLMRAEGIDAYLVPGSDPHQSEYVAAHWKGREWLSDFTGSAGVLVVTPDHAGLWTDSRYFIQAETELAGSGITLHKQRVPHAPEHVEWLAEHLPMQGRLGIDGYLFSVGQVRYLERRLAGREVSIDFHADLLSAVWTDRPPLPSDPVFELDIAYAGQSRAEKLADIRREMERMEVEWHLLSTLDDIAWLLNLRGSDVAFNPVFLSYLVVGETDATLFIQPDKVPEPVRKQLWADGVKVQPYAGINTFLREMPETDVLWVDTSSLNMRLFSLLAEDQLVRGDNLARRRKAIKNETEIGHIRTAMRKDGVALTKLYRWLEGVLATRTVSEAEVARQLGHFRRAQGDYFGESFGAIVGYQANGAIVHYQPDPENAAQIRPEGILLIDSGGQYLQGTTDITRTVALGPPTPEQRRNFTLILQGHLALTTARFPAGTTGVQLDTLARLPLWRHGLNYGHGTGHGVGYFLNVHEPPQGFATGPTTSRGTTAIEPGMLTSNEPGYYKAGEYGMRFENLILCAPAEETEDGTFYQFETLTLFPIDLRLVDAGMLSQEEKDWINDYHRQVFDEISPLLNPEEVAWLRERCGTVD